jgi:hypothetical protein
MAKTNKQKLATLSSVIKTLDKVSGQLHNSGEVALADRAASLCNAVEKSYAKTKKEIAKSAK